MGIINSVELYHHSAASLFQYIFHGYLLQCMYPKKKNLTLECLYLDTVKENLESKLLVRKLRKLSSIFTSSAKLGSNFFFFTNYISRVTEK